MLRAAPLVLLSLLGADLSALEAEPDAFLQRLLAETMEQRQELLRQHLAPTPITLPAGTRNLADAVAALRQAGTGDILLQLGTADQEAQELPAIDSTWWSALLKICRRFHVEPVPPMIPSAQHEQHIRQIGHYRINNLGEASQRIFGGPVQLRPAIRQGPASRLAQLHPCGTLLVESFGIAVTDIRHLEGESRNAELRFRLRLQPGLRDDLVRHAAVTWEAATDGDGTTLAIEERADQDLILQAIHDLPKEPVGQRRSIRHRRPLPTESSQLRLGHLPASCRQVQLQGSVELTCGAPLELLVALAPGEDEQAASSPVPVHCALIEPAADDLQQRHRLSIRYRRQDFAVPPQVTISDPNGNMVRHYNRNTVPSDDDEFITEIYSLAAPLAGKYQIRLVGTVDLGAVLLPLLLQVPLP